MTRIYVAEYVEEYDHSNVIGAFDTWEALTYYLSKEYAHWMDEGLTPTIDGYEDGEPVKWQTPQHRSYLRVTLTTLRTAIEPAYEVRMTYIRDGEPREQVVRGPQSIDDEAHAAALAAQFNDKNPFLMPGAATDIEFFVRRAD